MFLATRSKARTASASRNTTASCIIRVSSVPPPPPPPPVSSRLPHLFPKAPPPLLPPPRSMAALVAFGIGVPSTKNYSPPFFDGIKQASVSRKEQRHMEGYTILSSQTRIHEGIIKQGFS